jgi:transposase-like protein
VLTRDLLANWNRLERTLAEYAPPGQSQQSQAGLEQEQPEAGEMTDRAEEEADANAAHEFRNSIDHSSVDRETIARAIEDRGYTVTSLAQELGVDPPAISRILRKPKDTQGDPGGRNPSMGLASEICRVLRLDPTAAFPDIFAPQQAYEPRHQRNAGHSSKPRNDNPSNMPQ